MMDSQSVPKIKQNIKKQSFFISIIMAILAVIIVAWMNAGIFTYLLLLIPNYIRYAVYFIWLGLAIISSKRFLKIFIYQSWPLLLFYFYILFISFFIQTEVRDYFIKNYIMSITYLIMVYSLFLYYINSKYKKISKIICGFLIVDIVVVGINTYMQLQANPMITRILATAVEVREKLLGGETFFAVGSYGYFYALVAIVLLLGFLFLHQKRNRIITFIMILAGIILLFKAQFAIAILFTFILLISMIILKYTNKFVFGYIFILVIMSLLLFKGTYALMFKQIADMEMVPAIVSEKFNDIAIYLSTKDVSDTQVEGRKDRYYQSIEAFANNMSTGIITSYGNDYRIGGHSAWFDLLATFGLFSILFFVFLYRAYKYCRKIVPLKYKPFINIYWFYFICLGFINTLLFAPIYTIWFLFLPLFMVNFYDNTLNKIV